MRILRPFAALSAGVLSLSLAGAALAQEPGLRMRSGHFPVPGRIAGVRTPDRTLEKAAHTIAFEQIPWGADVAFGPARTVTLGRGERVVKLPQAHLGVPVAMRGVAVAFDDDSAATLVTAALEEQLPASVTPSIGAEQAAAVAAARARIPHDPSRAVLAIWPTADGAKLVWAIDIKPVPGIPYLPVTVVDAATGEIVLVYNAIKSLDHAKVYPSNPVKSPALVDVTLPVGAGETALQNDLIQSKNCIDTKSAKTLDFMGFPLKVHTCDLLQTALRDGAGDYLNAPAMDRDPEDAFSEVSMFYHANRAYDFFRSFDAALDVNGGAPLPTVSNLRTPQGLASMDLSEIGNPDLPLDPFQNAFFAPSNPLFSTAFGIDGGAMWFGQGPLKDYSYDGDVIYHEFTHAVVNVTLQLAATPHLDELGTSFAPGAMNEGLADYFSSALSGDPDVGEYAVQDIFPGAPFLRSLANPDACPSAIGGEVHQDATLFSGSLWDARKTLSASEQADFDRSVFTAMNKSATGDLGYEDFAAILLEAITASPLGQPVADKLKAAFTARGVLPRCSRVLEYAGAPLLGPKDLQGIWMAPGTETTGVKAPKGWTPGVVQAHSALPADAATLTVSFTPLDIGGGGGGGTPFKPQLLVRFAKDPIRFKYKPLAAQADDVLVPLTRSDATYAGTIDVPAGAADAYVMVVNAGQSDGAYTQLSLGTEGPATTATATVSATSTGAGGSSSTATGAGGSSTEKPDVVVDGCGCAVPGGEPESTTGALAAIAMLGLVASRRRRQA